MSQGATALAVRLIWEWPLRVWHWCLALCIGASLGTGLAGDIGLMEWHMRFGYAACGLLLFRLVWGFVGGRYSRWRNYRTTPARVFAHFRGAGSAGSHTAPGIALALALLVAVAAQATSGLFATDDIFIEGPLVRIASDEVVGAMTALHHRVFWVVIGIITLHLTAHLIYAIRGSRMPLAMFTGRKLAPAALEPAESSGQRAVVVALAAAGVVWLALLLV